MRRSLAPLSVPRKNNLYTQKLIKTTICISLIAMTTEQQSDLEEIKKLISDRFDRQDEKINDIRIEIVKVESRLGEKINEVESKLAQDLAGIKVDATWIKWLFGGLLSFILILLSVIITVIFKLIT